MAGRTTSRVTFNQARIKVFTHVAPVKAFRGAALMAAGVGARKIKSKRSQRLAREVAIPKFLGPLRAAIGSGLPYARIENDGGIIRPVRAERLLIRETRGGDTRSDVGGDVVASADQVKHVGKHYLEAARDAYRFFFLLNLRKEMPR